MVLPLYLAMNASEIKVAPLPRQVAWMACQFSGSGNGIQNIPASLPPDSILILNDFIPCQGHSPVLVAAQLIDAATRMSCESILLDFQRPENEELRCLVTEILDRTPVPVAVSELYAASVSCPVFLSPAPLHISLAEYLEPWKNREVWLEAALCQETVRVTREGTCVSSCFPAEGLAPGFYDESLRCCYHTRIFPDAVEFKLFDTPDTLPQKLELAHNLGVARAVGLYQELSTRMQ